MPQTIRSFLTSPFNGRRVQNFNWNAIDSDSVVLVTASEYAPVSNPPPAANLQRFVGDANIWVSNVTPHGPPFDNNHGVTFVINVDFPHPLFVAFDITVLDAKPIEVQG